MECLQQTGVGEDYLLILIIDGWKDLFVTNGIRRDVNNKDFYNEHRDFFDKMENDPKYKNKEEEVNLLSYLEKCLLKTGKLFISNQKDQGFINRNTDWGLEEKTFSNGWFTVT